MSFVEGGEQPGATATATPDSETPGAPSGLGDETPTPEAKPTEEVRTEAPESPEGAETPVADQTPAPLPEGWQDHPDAKPIFDNHFKNGRGQRERELRTEMGRREERYSTEIKDAFRQGSAAEVVSNVVDALKEGFDLDEPEGVKALGKVLRNHASWADVFTNAGVQAAEAKMVRDVKSVVREAGLSEEVAGQLSDIEGELSWKVRHGETTLAGGLRELIQTSFKHIKALGAQEEKERRDKLETEMTGAADRAGKRKGKSPPAAPSGAGAGSDGRSDRELQLDPNTPVATLKEIKARREASR